MLSSILKKAGLNDKESTIYLSLLEIGSQPASVIGRKAGVNRSTTYLILDSLIKKGYVNQHVRADIKYFTAADPQVIVQLLERKEKHFGETREELVDILPQFYALSNPLSIKPKVKFYEGEEGVKRAMMDTFTSTETLLSWDAMDSWLNSTPELKKFVQEYARLRVEKYKIPVKVLFFDTPTSRKYILKDYPPLKKKKNPLMDFRWVPKGITKFNNEINVYNDKVSIVSLAKNEMLGVIIESHEIAQTMKSIFQMAWKSGRKYKL